MRETWPFKRECFNYFSDENYSVPIRDRFGLRNPSAYPKKCLTILEAIQIAKDFEVAERPFYKQWNFVNHGGYFIKKFYKRKELPKPGL